MGIIQENRNGVAGPEKVTTDYGVENVNVTGNSAKEPAKKSDKPSEEEKKREANAKLFSSMMEKAIEAKKLRYDDERINKFSETMQKWSDENGGETAVPDPEVIIGALSVAGMQEFADTFTALINGEDLDAAIAALPDAPEVEDDEKVSTDTGAEADGESTATGDVTDAAVGTDATDAPSYDASTETDTEEVGDDTPANDAAAEEKAPEAENGGKRRPGRPSKKQ